VTERHLPRAPGADVDAGAGRATTDLHTHTTRSDGVLEPDELVRQAAGAGVRLLAIADHDNLAAVRELARSTTGVGAYGVELVPAVEINAVTTRAWGPIADGEIHVLGLGVDPEDEAFEALLAHQRSARRERFDEMVRRLRDLGMPIDAQLERIDVSSDDALGRPTIARALMAAGFASSVEDAFDRLIARGKPAYVPRTGLDPAAAIRAIRAAGGLASLAHFPEAPKQIPLLRELIGEGLNGLESHHRSFEPETRAAVSAVARELGLVETGGTDYHGDLGPYAESHAELVLPEAIARAARAAIEPGRIRTV
jgi:predicted metal-dependent phosphoesterase TrpH